MHHLYPSVKGDPLCPLGFHPQVRWPTRCKRCFRDYKEHGGRKRDDDIPLRREDVTASSPSLSIGSSASRSRDDGRSRDEEISSSGRSWTSSQNLSLLSSAPEPISKPKRPASWTSTPDLGHLNDDTKAEVTVSVSLPRRRFTTELNDTGQNSESYTLRRPPQSPSSKPAPVVETITINKNDTLAERVKKMQAIKRQGSLERENSKERDIPRKEQQSTKRDAATEPPKRISVKEVRSQLEEPSNHDVQFLIQVKNKSNSKKNSKASQSSRRSGSGTESSDDDTISIAGTETTETTLVDKNESELYEQIESLKQELEATRTRCERAERDKSDILLRRLAAMDTTPSRTSASEMLKLQQKVNELKGQGEELRDEKKSLSLRVRELECELAARPTHTTEEVLRNKLQAAETLCEELMDENEDMKKELRGMEDEIDEMTDNFREDQCEEYSNLKKELDAANKNVRILAFKLKKADRRLEALDAERQANGIGGVDLVQKVRQLEQELSVANEVARRLQEEIDSGKSKKKAPLLGNIGKSSSAEGKVSRESLTRGGSQEDPVQLLRDLQDSLEREADLREQLRFAEEEAQNLRKKASRVEDDNESLVMQLKKMATKARTRKLSPTAPTNRLTPEPPVEKDEGISDEEDPAELRLLLELNEQEASVLRRKVEDLETESETAKRQVRELTDRLASKAAPTKKSLIPTGKGSTLADQKIKVLEDEASELRKKLLEKERDYERLHAELNFAQRKPKGSLAKSKSLDGSFDQQSLDLRRQMQVVEQEAAVLRTRTQKLEVDNDKLSAENKKLQLQALRTTIKKESVDKSDDAKSKLDAKTAAADAEKLKTKDTEINKLKQSITKIETERDTLVMKLKTLKDDAATVFPPRTPKRPTDMTTKLQMKKMVEELESEIGDYVVVLRNAGANKVTALEGEKKKLNEEVKGLKEDVAGARLEIKSLEAKRDEASSQQSKQFAKVAELEKKIKTSEEALATSQKALTSSKENITKTEKKLSEQIEQCKKLESAQKLALSEKASLESKIKTLENNLKQEKDKAAAIPKNTGPTPEMIKLKKERDEWENKVSDMEHDLQLSRKEVETLKTKHEKEMASLKARSNPISAVKKTQDLQDRVEKLESTLSTERKSYEELTAKYEILEEEHVVTKAQLTMEKEALQSQISTSQNITTAKDSEIRKIKDSHEQQANNWEKEKSNLEILIKDLEDKVSRGNTIEMERSRLKGNLEDRINDLEQSKREAEMLSDQMDYLRKENEELRKKLDDYDKVNKVQRNMTADSSAMEHEMKQLRTKLEQAEKLRKSDIANCKLRYDGQVTTLNEELQSLQSQVQRFKREKDTFKQMLDSAQKTIGDLKNQPSSGRQSRNSLSSEDTEESRMKLASLEQQVGCMEDELCEARLEASKLKTELVSERSAWEIKLSEMQSRVNELEEDRLLASGRLKVSGMKTRMELAWSREREEQQRLLQETSKLARDLRQTLFEVERERDKERLESKRKLEQVKKTTEEEQDENRRKVTELQCDLLELRDAHAKLRTTNEKLRREKERHDRERDDLRGAASYRRRFDQDGDRKVGALLDQVEELVKIAPELQKTTPGQSQIQTNTLTPTPPRRTKVRSRPNSRQHSRESTPGDERSGSPSAQLANVLARLADASEELRKFQKINEEDRDRDRARRTLGIRRAASTEHDNTDNSTRAGSAPRSISRGGPHNGSLHRKSLSLSLDQGPQHENIWKADDDSLSSMQSLDAEADSRYYNTKRDTSLDSRLSGGSTQSDVLPSGKKKKTGLMGKLKKLTKSRSIDDHSGSAEFSVSSTVNSQHQGSDSDMSVSGDHRSSKKDLKGRITGMFKKSGSTSRSNSTERVSKPIGTPLPDRNDSTQRPLARNGSNSNLVRPVGPARPPSSAAATPASQRRAK